MQPMRLILSLVTIGSCIYGTYPAGPLQSPRSSYILFAEDGEEWRNNLPDKLSDRKGAPLHKIIIQSTSNPLKKVIVYLLGTSHVSKTSCEDAKLLMEYARPGKRNEKCNKSCRLNSIALTGACTT